MNAGQWALVVIPAVLLLFLAFRQGWLMNIGWKIFTAIAIVILAVWILKSCSGGKSDEESAAATAAPPVQVDSVDGLFNPKSCTTTPGKSCTIHEVTYPFRVKRYGPIRVKWPGIGWMEYTGSGPVKAPSGVEVGDFEFESLAGEMPVELYERRRVPNP